MDLKSTVLSEVGQTEKKTPYKMRIKKQGMSNISGFNNPTHYLQNTIITLNPLFL